MIPFGPVSRACIVAAIAFAASACWSEQRAHERFLDFDVGMSKREVFDAARESQRTGEITNLEVIGDAPKTYAQQYHGTPIRSGDFERVEPFAEWHAGLPDCNCWIRLHFDGERLDAIVTHEWTGPTE